MKKLFILLLFIASTLLAQEPSQVGSLEGKSSSVIVQNDQENQESPVITSPFPHYFKRMLISLSLLIGLMILTVWALKRLMRSREKEINEQKKIKILEKRVLSPKSLLYLVEVEGEKVLISESHLEIRPLQTLKKEDQE